MNRDARQLSHSQKQNGLMLLFEAARVQFPLYMSSFVKIIANLSSLLSSLQVPSSKAGDPSSALSTSSLLAVGSCKDDDGMDDGTAKFRCMTSVFEDDQVKDFVVQVYKSIENAIIASFICG